MRRVVGAVLCSVVALVVTGQSWADQQRRVLVAVLDKDNTPIVDLVTSDFLVYEDGVSRTVTEAVLSKDPLAVVILVDTGKSQYGTTEPTRDIRAGVQAFVRTIAAAGIPTQMALMDYAGAGTVLQGFTEKLEDVERIAGRLVPSQRSNSVLLETLPDAARDVGRRSAPRRAIVILDRGSLETSRVQQDRVVGEVQKSGASIWAVSVSSPAGPSPAKEVALEMLTEATGGMHLTAVSHAALEGLMTTVAQALASQYVVTFTGGADAPQSVVAAATRGTKFLRAPWRSQ